MKTQNVGNPQLCDYDVSKSPYLDSNWMIVKGGDNNISSNKSYFMDFAAMKNAHFIGPAANENPPESKGGRNPYAGIADLFTMDTDVKLDFEEETLRQCDESRQVLSSLHDSRLNYNVACVQQVPDIEDTENWSIEADDGLPEQKSSVFKESNHVLLPTVANGREQCQGVVNSVPRIPVINTWKYWI